MTTCKTIVLAQPETGGSINYEIPADETAQLSFGPDQIDGLKLNDFGGLEISFLDGGTVTITNFQTMIDGGNLLYLNDGTLIDPSVLNLALGGFDGQSIDNAGVITIVSPAADTKREINLETGKKYEFDFEFSDPKKAELQDGNLVISFQNNGELVLNNYVDAMNGEFPAQLALEKCETVLDPDALIQALNIPAEVPSEDVLADEQYGPEAPVKKSKIQNAELAGADDIGANDPTGLQYAGIEPAAGESSELDSVAEALQDIEPAAGDEGGAARDGYGFQSQPGSEPLGSIDDVGPINPTALRYVAPEFTDEPNFIPQSAPRPDDRPNTISPIVENLDETNLDGGPLVETGTISVNFGNDGPGSIGPNGSASASGSLAGGVLSSNGVPVVITQTANGYEGKAGGVTIFTLTVDPLTGQYTYTQFEEFDHADGTNPDDVISLNFGIVATDRDGDSISTTIIVNVADDAPVISGASETVDETNLGPIVESGTLPHDFNQDGAGSITPNGNFVATGSLLGGALTSNGVLVVVTQTANGYVGTAGGTTVFSVSFNPTTGEYEYKQYENLDHADASNPNDIITLNFGVKITDGDGDTANTTLVINVKDDAPTFDPDNGQPQIGKGYEVVDETNLTGGPNVVNGSLPISGNGDSPLTVGTTGTFVAGGSLAGGVLSSNGVPVTVSATPTGYVGSAGGTTVFTVTINPTTGAYTFTQFEELDHADGTNPNDTITLTFGVKVTDADGDTATSTMRIDVKDDAPVISGASETVDETNLGPIVETGTLANNFGQDGAGNIAPNGTFTAGGSLDNGVLTSNGVPIVVTQTANGYEGKAGAETIFTVTFNPTTGAYEYKQFGNLDHADNNNPNDIITLNFGVRITDGDGDTANTTLVIKVKDDAPVFQPDGPKPDSGLETVDETNLGPIVETGKLNANFGADTPGSYAFTTGTPQVSGSVLGGTLTSLGVPVTIALVGGVYVGTAGATEVFTLTLNPSTGDYAFTLKAPLDHADGSNPNDVISITFDVAALDSEGEAANGEIRINIKDDAPVAENDFNTFDTTLGGTNGNVITGVNGGPNAADNLSNDVSNKVTKIAFGGNVVNVPQDGSEATIEGQFGVLKIKMDGSYTYTLKPGVLVGGGDEFDFFPSAGNVAGVQSSLTIDGITISSNNGADLRWVDEGFGGGVGIAGEGSDKVFGGNEFMKVTYATPVVSTTIHLADIGPNNVGNTFTYKVYVDGVAAPITKTVVLSPVNGGGFDFTINSSDVGGNITRVDLVGGPSFTVCGIEATTPGVDCTHDQFVYTLTDRDGDSDPATLDLKGKDLTDNIPLIAEPIVETVDETNLGPITETGTVSVNYFGEGPGAVSVNGGFASTGSKLGGALTHDGVPVVVTVEGNKYVGKAGGVTVFDLTVQSNGDYTFKLYENLDHADASNPNDVITLTFGVTATDADGDTDTATITVNVKDDAPVANDDNGGTVNEGVTVNGNVTSNDDAGEDNPGTVTKVVFNGTSYDVPATGFLSITTGNGVFKINAAGAYEYKANSNNPTGTDNFTYTLRDRDGDTDTANIRFNIVCDDDTPVLIQPEKWSIDETNLGPITLNGDLNANFFGDGPGTFMATNSFTSTGSKLGGNLTHNGVPVNVTLSGNTYTGTAGDKKIFELKLETNGDYTFKLFDNLDHADGSNPNDIITLDFGVKAVDADGDFAAGTITINVADDVPSINQKFRQVDETNLTGGPLVVQDVLTHSFGQDGPGKIQPNGTFMALYQEGGANQTLTATGVPIVVSQTANGYIGKAGDKTIFTLEINSANGQYTYKQFDNIDHPDGSNPDDVIWLKFFVDIVDYDGDKDTAFIGIDVHDDGPCANDDSGCVNECKYISGNVLSNDAVGTDTPGKVIKVTFNGYDYSVPATGQATITGAYGVLKISANGDYTYTSFNVNGDVTDHFTYTMKDFDGDTDTAALDICIKNDVNVSVSVNNNVDDVCVKEDGSVLVPMHAEVSGGSGNETLTLTLSGVGTGWQVTTPGWTNLGGGKYSITLAPGVKVYDAFFTFKPPANSDVDLNGLNLKASVYDPDISGTVEANDGFNIIVDAVADAVSFNAQLTPSPWADGTKIFILTHQDTVQHSQVKITNILRPDTDGSESLQKIVFTLPHPVDETTFISVKNANGTYSQIGTKTDAGNGATNITIDLSGMTYDQAKDLISNKLYLTNDGPSKLDGYYNMNVEIVTFEKNLSGVEKDFKDNTASYIVCLPIVFCLSPLVLDMDRDGIELLNISEGVSFDMNQDGVADRTGWVGKDDGLLTLDKNGDGIVNDRSELFGNTETAKNGFEDLATFDENGDGIIDAKDSVYSSLKVWQDKNTDGVSQGDELVTLDQAGVAQINLNAQSVQLEIAGNPVSDVSTAVLADGSTTEVADVWFAYVDGTETIEGSTLEGGTGNDVLLGGEGGDILFGGEGADNFLFAAITEAQDTIKDFNAAEGDTIDISQLLENYDPVTDAISDFVYTTSSGGNTTIAVDVNGTGNFANAMNVVTLEGQTVSLTDLMNQHALVA